MNEKSKNEMAGNEPLPVSNYAINGSFDSDHSLRTKVGIVRSREQGREWGTYGKTLAKRNIEEAISSAENLRPLLIELGVEKRIWGKGNETRATWVARELNARGIPTKNGGRWHPTSVKRLLKHLGQSLRDEIELIRATQASEILAKCFLPGHPALKAAIAHLKSLEKGMTK